MKEYRKNLAGLWSSLKENAAVAAVYVLLVVFGFLFYNIGIVEKQELETYDNRITLIRTDGNAYSYQEAEQMRLHNQEAEAPFSYALWGAEGVRSLQNQDLGRNTQAEVYVVEGSSDLLLSSSVILDGTVEKSCLIGEEGAVFLAKDLHTFALDRMNARVSDDVALSSLERSVEGELGFSGTALDYRFINSLLGLMDFGLFLLLWLWLLRLMAAELLTYWKPDKSRLWKRDGGTSGMYAGEGSHTGGVPLFQGEDTGRHDSYKMVGFRVLEPLAR